MAPLRAIASTALMTTPEFQSPGDPAADPRRAAAKRTAWIVGGIALLFFLAAILQFVAK